MDSTIARVNVGGVIFTTTVSTLQKAKYFGELALQPDLSEVVIDRCPRAFEYLLNCLRDRSYIIPECLHEYQPEIHYFGMDCLTLELKVQLPTITVDPASKFSITIWHGIAFLQSKEDMRLEKGELLELGISISACPRKYLDIRCPNGAVGKVFDLIIPYMDVNVRVHRDVNLKKGQDLCYLLFPSDGPGVNLR